MLRKLSNLMLLLITVALLVTACAPAATPAPAQPPAQPTAAPAPTKAPEPTKAPQPTAVPVPTKAAEPTKAPEPTKAAAAAATPAAAGARNLQGEIQIARVGKPEPWQAVADAYMKINPGVKVTVDMKPSEGYWEWVRAQFASGTPKVSLVADNGVLDLVNAGRFVDFRPYFEQVNPYTNRKFGDDLNYKTTQRFYGPFGEVWWLGYEQGRVYWAYNKSIFEKVGVQPPKNWDELVNACQKIKAAGYVPMAIGGKDFWNSAASRFFWGYADQYTRDWIKTARAQPGDWNFVPGKDDKWQYNAADPFNDDAGAISVNWVRLLKGIRDGELRFDTPAFKELYKNIDLAIPECMPDGFFGLDDTQAYQLFLIQKAGMYWAGGGFVTQFEGDIAALQKGNDKATPVANAQVFEYGLFNNPSMTGGLVQGPMRSWESTSGYLAVPVKDAKQNALEVDFLMFLASPQGYQALGANRIRWQGVGPGQKLE